MHLTSIGGGGGWAEEVHLVGDREWGGADLFFTVTSVCSAASLHADKATIVQ